MFASWRCEMATVLGAVEPEPVSVTKLWADIVAEYVSGDVRGAQVKISFQTETRQSAVTVAVAVVRVVTRARPTTPPSILIPRPKPTLGPQPIVHSFVPVPCGGQRTNVRHGETTRGEVWTLDTMAGRGGGQWNECEGFGIVRLQV